MAEELTPSESGTAVTRTLRRAAGIAGGLAELAAALGVAATDLERWMAGEVRPPQNVFLAALDIVSGAVYEQNARNSQHAADRAQAAADRAQAGADRAQATADRDRAKADRAQATADRDRAKADPKPAPQDEHLRQMTSREQNPAANKADQQKKEG